jgi:DNA-binding MarR family transcriptional regulator
LEYLGAVKSIYLISKRIFNMGYYKKNYFSHYSPNVNAREMKFPQGTYCEVTNSREPDLTRLEIKILRCTRSNAKTETRISKEIKVNLPTVSQLITDLMLKGFLQRTRNRRTIFFPKKDSFSTTIEGLMALERNQKNGSNRTLLSQVLYMVKDSSHRIVEEATPSSLALKLFFGTLRLVYQVTKYALRK